MTPRERLLATMRGEDADRVPLSLEGFHFLGRDEVERIEEPERREIAERVYPRSRGVISVPSRINRHLVTPPQRVREVSRTRGPEGGLVVRCEIDTPSGPLPFETARNPGTNTWWTTRYPCNSVEDLERLAAVPWETPEGLAPPDLEGLSAEARERGIVETRISSPFVCVAGAVPYQTFLELCATHYDLVHELTALCLERVLAVLDVLLADETVEYVWMGGCEWLTPPMASPALYGKLVHAFEAPIIERCHAAGAVVHVHCHGNVRDTLGMVVERGADFCEPVEPPPDGDITFADAKALVAERMTLGGNVESRVMTFGTPDEAEAATRAAFEGGKRRMVLETSVGPIGPFTPRLRDNYHRLLDVWDELAPLPARRRSR